MTKVLGAPAKAHEAGLIAPLSNVDNTANLLTALKAEHITLSALSVAQPTLDEVFLSLTGHAATSDQPQPQTERTAS
jgi:ABC-2 type transport system ATP-binding protein